MGRLPGRFLELLGTFYFTNERRCCIPSDIDTTANMAGPSDKARFYLEQSATELNELERKKIFTRVSIRPLRALHCTGLHYQMLTPARKRSKQ